MAKETQGGPTRFHPRTLAIAAAGVAVVVLAAAIFAATQQQSLAPAGANAPDLESDIKFLTLDGSIDTDNDGLSDATENYVTGSDPNAWNSSGGPIPDGWLHRFGYDPIQVGIESRGAAAPPIDAVPAAFGINGRTALTPTLWDVYAFERPADWDEPTDGPWNNLLDPREWDQNSDGIPDGFLLRYGMDPTADVKDARPAGPTGFTVAEAFEHNTDPTRLDTDGDGILDRIEIAGGPLAGGFTFPPTDPSRYDSNGAGICDGFLAYQGIDPNDVAAARGDGDKDGATAMQEFQWSLKTFGDAVCKGQAGLSLKDATSGTSTIPDGWLIQYDLNPFDAGLDSRVTQKASTDPVPTGIEAQATDLELKVLDEYRANRPADWDEATQGPWMGGTDPTKPDTDGDGLGDAWELRGYSVQVATDVGPSATALPQSVRPDPTRADTDGDGISDGTEAINLSDATRRDTDLDGLPDGFESEQAGLDPLRADSAGDYMRDGDRYLLLTGRAKAYADTLDYDCPGSCLATKVTDWLSKAGGASDLLPLDSATVVALVGPNGNIDGDIHPNLIDDDIDGDGIPNGVEADPVLYAQTGFGLGLFSSRPTTDPLNIDTDGDGLRDGWEVQHGLANTQTGRYDLDPSDWDSDGDGVGDGDTDPDGDGIEWLAFVADGKGHAAHSQTYEFNNLREQQFGTDPHDATSDGDGLRDGWKVFWGQVYPSMLPGEGGAGHLYPGAPGDLSIPAGAAIPTIGVPQPAQALGTVETSRFIDLALAESNRLPHETIQPTTYSVPAPGGSTRTVVELAGTRTYTFQDAQSTLANPYVADTDGDGMPDAWEFAHGTPPPDPECLAVSGPRPAVPDADLDPDGDGLSNGEEYQWGQDANQPSLHPLCPDHDHGGTPDGAEVLILGRNPTLPTDDLSDDGLDQDHDGVSDIQERRTLDTDPLDADTDGDGLLDDDNLPASGGYAPDSPEATRFLDLGIAYQILGDGTFQFLGEASFSTDPLDADELGIGVPQGWLVARGLDPLALPSDPATVRTAYQVAIPAWWSETDHGPWWGGAANAAEIQDPSVIAATTDLDLDGLPDRSGEDPMPGVNHHNVPRAIDAALHGTDPLPEDPRTTDLTPLQRRLAAQAWLGSPEHTPSGITRDTDPGRFNDDLDHTSRTQPTLTADPPANLLKGGAFTITGTLVSDVDGDGQDDPVTGVTVVATIAGEAVGVAVTGADGSYTMDAAIAASHQFTIPDNALVVLGERSGTVAFTTDTSRIDPGALTLTISSYATPRNDAFTATWPPVEAATFSKAVTIRTEPNLKLDVPETVTAGNAITITVTTTDGAGDPLSDPLQVTTPHGTSDPLPPNGQGTVVYTVATSAADAGPFPVTARVVPASQFVDGATVSKTPHVLQLTTLTVKPLPASVDGGSDLPVSGKLLLKTGNVPVSGATVTVTAGDAEATATTQSDGTYAATVRLPADQAPGELLVLINAEATQTTHPGSVSATTTVLGRPVLRDLSPILMPVGDGVAIRGTITEPDGRPLAGASVRYILDDQTGTLVSGDDGTFGTTINWDPPTGPRLQQLRFERNAIHAAAGTTLERFPFSATALQSEPGEVARGAPLQLKATLVDAAGRVVPGVPVTASTEQAGHVSAVTDAAGRATLELPSVGMDLGAHEVLLSYAGSGDGSLLASEAKVAWTVFSALKLSLPDGPSLAGDTPPEPRLVDAGTGDSVVRTLRLESESGTRTVTTALDGSFGLFGSFPPSTTPQTYSWRVMFDGDDAYSAFEEKVSIRVVLPVDVDLRLDDRLIAGKAQNALITVTDVLDAPASGRVHLLLGETPVGDADLQNGRASIPIWPETAGVSVLRVIYDGSLLHGAAEHEQPVNVLSPTNLIVNVTPLRGGDARIDVSATDGSEPLPFRTVHLSIQGLPGGVTVETDDAGRASYVIHNAAEGLAVSARLDAGFGEEPSLATATVGGAAPALRDLDLLWIVLAGLAVLAIVASLGIIAVRLWRRRSPLEQDLRETLRTIRGTGPVEEVILHAYYVLQRAALRQGWLEDEAATPRALQENLQREVRRMPVGPLGALVGLFEAARYGNRRLDESHRALALRATQAIRRTTAWGGRA